MNTGVKHAAINLSYLIAQLHGRPYPKPDIMQRLRAAKPAVTIAPESLERCIRRVKAEAGL